VEKWKRVKKRPGYAQTIPGVSLKEEKEGYDHTMGRISRKKKVLSLE